VVLDRGAIGAILQLTAVWPTLPRRRGRLLAGEKQPAAAPGPRRGRCSFAQL